MRTEQINVEYFFRLLYELFYGGSTTVDFSAFQAFVAHVWFWIIIVGYAVSLVGFLVILYASVRLFELRKREEEYYSTIIDTGKKVGETSDRWQHIESLIQGGSPSEWREAITEADIMLDDVLTKNGYKGDNIGEKLKSVDRDELATLNDAWEAHKVRNQIAHEGSAFDLSETLAQRTIQRYEAVFRECKEI